MDIYLLFKIFHLIAVISWMAGLLYLPRIFVYHCQTSFGSETHEKFVQMEYRLLKFIMNPAMIVSWILGIGLLGMLGHEAGYAVLGSIKSRLGNCNVRFSWIFRRM